MNPRANILPNFTYRRSVRKSRDPYPISILPVSDHSHLFKFLHFPHSLYDRHPYWVPPMISAEREAFQAQKNPLLKRARIQLFLAEKPGKTLGRIACMINEDEVKKGTLHARIGWMDFVDNPKVSASLIETASNWARGHGMEYIKGPYGLTNFDHAGLLTRGFHEISTQIETYSYPYYMDHLENLGFTPELHWKEYEFPVNSIPEKLQRLSSAISARYGLQIKEFSNKEEMKEWVPQFTKLIRESYSSLPTYVPMREEDLNYYVRKFFPMLTPQYTAMVIDRNQELVGFGIATPSLVKALQKSRGRIFPFGWYHLQKAFRNHDRAELNLIGVRPDMQHKGVPALIITKIWQEFIKNGVKWVESNQELTTNTDIHNLWTAYNGRQHKERKTFIKRL